MSTTSEKDEIHRHSGWLIPGIFFFVILVMSGLFLGWYLRPGPKSAVMPTGQSVPVQASVRGLALSVPANYVQNAAARLGGEMDSLSLTALFPSWRGYSDADAKLFSGNAPDSPVILLSLHGAGNSLSGRERLERIYMPYIANPKGAAGPFGLVQYSFVSNSGYEGSELFRGETDKGLVLLLCERAAGELTSPNCLAIDRPLTRTLAFSYRFKRAYLARWREMSSGADRLIAQFRTP